MPRLIDAEHLKKRATDTTGDCWDNYGQGTADFLEYIYKEPIVDAVEVVRCKDCKWWKTIYFWEGHEHKVCVRESHELLRKAEDFCSYGERR